MHNFKQIYSFFEIKLERKTLVVLDIDDTIIKYSGMGKQWWKSTFESYYKISQNYDKADKQTLNDWKIQISLAVPLHIDENGVFDLFKRAKELECTIIFLTARNQSLETITYEHLKQLGIEEIKIYFSPDVEKGITLDEIKNNDCQNYDDIIFVDDLHGNLVSVHNNTNHPNIKCYHMIENI
jgi:hypothetical protein